MVHCSPVMWNHPIHDDVIKWKHFPCYWPFVRGIHRRQRPVTRSFDVFFDLRLNLQLSKQLRRWWFETLPRSLWHHCNEFHRFASKLAEIYVKMNIRSLTMFRRPLATIRPKCVEGHDFFYVIVFNRCPRSPWERLLLSRIQSKTFLTAPYDTPIVLDICLWECPNQRAEHYFL